ncbi:MAG: betaine-aldehyde dehydrogenase [Sulfobacillus thermosulfidooxidans]|uniref:Betaine-aldehyde dehydrogenase n=1 Tax=Sulfobacillus thermotolerans TaxID=338644 RepID=A0ABN5H441_9FIRM|nr:betaine-aldehyde dehydrogenase [Sulfobacillus thermotolerans]PSR36965.1 MAG: betaine-aldehyde dehydrogenase [Sulfobacillus thermosulfidooxidans]
MRKGTTKVEQILNAKASVQEFIQRTHRHFIGGEWVPAASGETMDDIDPSTRGVLTQVARGDSADVDRAVAAAAQAFRDKAWRHMSPQARGVLMWKLADLMAAHLEELAQIDSLDMGMPLRQAQYGTVPMAIDHMRYMAGWATKIEGETIPVSAGPFFNYTVRQPVGVVGAIIPWNFPLLMAIWKLGAALAVGCTVVLKPAEQSPLSVLRLAELITEAGFPPGVINIVTGYGPEAGAALVAHPGVNKIAFTGSTEVGKSIMRTAADRMARVSLELGGKSPNIICADANLKRAISGSMLGIFMNQGEVCSAGSRIYVAREIYDEALEQMATYAKNMRVGMALDAKTQMGPVVSAEQYERVLGYITKGRQEGATVIAGGGAMPAAGSGFFIEPTVFAQVTDTMTIAQEEIFGPVAAVMPFDTVDEVIERANVSAYGLAAGVWTENVRTAHYLAQNLEAGTVWVNAYHVYDAAAPWGGFKQSGLGREMGHHALELYTETKDVWISLQ